VRADRAVVLATLLAGCAGHVVPLPPEAVPVAERQVSLFLIGDAGKPNPVGDPVLAELTRQASAAPRGSAILFLGDNLYPHGLLPPEDKDRGEMERRLMALVDVARRSGLRTVFVPGNHDWDRMGKDGWNAVRRSEAFIRERSDGLAEQEPGGGCPGPAVVDVGESFRLLLLDTEWWLQKPAYAKPTDASSGCDTFTEAAVEERLTRLLAESGGRRVIVAGHHPLASAGEHGGHLSVATHIFPLRAVKRWLWVPLPIIGSIYPLARAHGISSQDLSGGTNKRMRAAFGRALEAHPPLLYAAGHDHNQQVFQGPSARYSVVSGAGIVEHEVAVGWGKGAVFASPKPGFMRLDVDRGGRVRLSVTVVQSDGAREAFGLWLTEP
jgi:calcineurin-like phosphoesterase family protein